MLNPIIITGCARSRTSMVAGIIEMCGAFGGKTCGATPYNRKGQFENVEIRNALIKPFLRNIGVDPMGQFPLPKTKDVQIDYTWKWQIEYILKNQGVKEETIWYLKSAKACLIWTQFVATWPGAKWIIVRRKDEDIVTSCLKTPFMRAFTKTNNWQWWVDQHKRKFEEMKKSKIRLKEIWSDKLIEGDFQQIREVVSWCNLTWKEKEVKNFITPRLTTLTKSFALAK